MKGLIIAIDGYSSTGKSTFAKLISKRLGVPYLDSGAMYRAVTLHSLEHSIMNAETHVIDLLSLARALNGEIRISYVPNDETGLFDICLCGVNVEQRIRMLDVSNNVSYIAAIPAVRNFVDDILHQKGGDGCVMDGRDIGTAVFPEADLKLFMTADARIRAQRRLDEMKAKGQEADFEEIYKNVKERDYIDSHRDYHPLRRPDDAIDLDNSNMTMEEQMSWLEALLKEKFDITF